MTVSKEQAMEALASLNHMAHPITFGILRQFIEQSQDSGHAAALTDKILLYIKSYLAEREDWPGTEDLIEDINFALAAAPAPTQQPAMRYDVLYEIAATFSLDYNAVCKVAHSVSGAAPTPQPELTDERIDAIHDAAVTTAASGFLLHDDEWNTDTRKNGHWRRSYARSLLGAAPTQPAISATLAAHAVEELHQLGYTVRDGRLMPPENLGELARAAGWSGAAPTQAVAWARLSQLESDEPTVIAPATYARLSADARSEFVPLVVGAVAPTQAPQQPVAAPAAGVALPRDGVTKE